MNKVVIGGVMGGIVMFIWGFVAHTMITGAARNGRKFGESRM